MNLYPELTLNSYFATETLAVWDILVSWIWKAVHANDVASDGEGPATNWTAGRLFGSDRTHPNQPSQD